MVVVIYFLQKKNKQQKTGCLYKYEYMNKIYNMSRPNTGAN